MTVMQSFAGKLAPLNVYDISEGSNIYAELCAYAFALDIHRENIDAALRECFISTSESFGLEIREKVFGNLRNNYSASERRDMLKLRRGFGDKDFTRAGLDKFLKSLGLSVYQIAESPGSYTITVTIYDALSETDAKWIENQIKLIMPAHLNAYVYNGGTSFNEIDGDDLTFDGFEALDKTWNALDYE